MNRTCAINGLFACALVFSSLVLADGDWKECSDSVEEQMYEKGQCGASGCFDENNRTAQEIIANKCGYPENTDIQAARIIEDLHNMPSESVFRAAMLYPPGSEVRRVLAEIEKKRHGELDEYRKELKREHHFSIDRFYALTDSMTVVVIRTNIKQRVRCAAIGPNGNYVAVHDATIEPPAEEVGIYTGGAKVESISCRLKQ
ncbi:MAG: hypothetical protein KFB96_00645 [Thiocapsa sp.]|uniref:hypothetical protein n=1 Tax=Thiocapsa sp. TaxID=2024551 RepID=UPI001BCD908C|nr:hypothetical protein [Thiocapsa sp.]QVL49084.1 MAG: hypothetical protein KFB96_00645 [Thiocapsa sp.]